MGNGKELLFITILIYIHLKTLPLISVKDRILFNPFLAKVVILYSLKTPENQRFSGVFRKYKMGTLVRNGSGHINLLIL